MSILLDALFAGVFSDPRRILKIKDSFTSVLVQVRNDMYIKERQLWNRKHNSRSGSSCPNRLRTRPDLDPLNFISRTSILDLRQNQMAKYSILDDLPQ